MYLIVGLGNPGEDYAHTRHNAGFDAIDIIATQARVSYWKTEGGALTAKAKLPVRANIAAGQGVTACEQQPVVTEEVLLVKPMGYMNTSGGPIKALCKTYGIAADHVIVIHDDMDLPEGTIRVKFGGGHAGHNGLKSICEKLATRDYYRVRVGIGHPEHGEVIDYVLQVPKREAKDAFEDAVQQASEAAVYLLEHGMEKTQQTFN